MVSLHGDRLARSNMAPSSCAYCLGEDGHFNLAQVVKLRFFVGLNIQEIGQLLDLNEKTVRRHWVEAKIRLYQAIKAD